MHHACGAVPPAGDAHVGRVQSFFVGGEQDDVAVLNLLAKFGCHSAAGDIQPLPPVYGP